MKKFAYSEKVIYLHLKIKFNQLKNNEAMFKATQNSTVGLPLMVVRLRGLVHS
ncbi:hypothetical protein [Chryseobacterium sp. IHB B 17019]|jgi:hypothetical protein|uniref:hypothetical protein n=1 Tax=Chryseobacterium sp. IHB B 17019 TaxID=1721091 RepID=UPI000A6D08AA|nr:hypothetical protein [Chryseobacterium sp. IHB B 17019]